MDDNSKEPATAPAEVAHEEPAPGRHATPETQAQGAGDDEVVVVEDVQQEEASSDSSPSGEESSADESAEQAAQADAAAAVEAVLFAADSPLTAARIVQVVKLPGQRAARQIIAGLNEKYEKMSCAFRIESLAGGYQMLTQPEHHGVLARLYRARSESKLSAAAMETLAIVAYRQPILRADVEAIRGVASGEVLRTLMERQMVKIVGRAEVLGRPMLYGTTRRFLEVFGLASLEDLPRIEELRSGAEKAPLTQAVPAAQPAPAAPPPQSAPDQASSQTTSG
ncbi:MAG: SMC-Scp complex subunit ScpB [Phycisphaerae bacterium]